MQLKGYTGDAMPELEIATPTDREVVMTRTFAAPRTLVFEALTTPAVLERWLMAPGRSLAVCEIDLRAGGAYRMIWRGPGRKDVGTHGVYREVVVPERIVQTEEWLDWDAGETLVTTVLVERQGRTKLTSTSLFPSQAVRDSVLKSGMEPNATETYARLESVLAELQRST
jgi:uncharacterized protein YndB with AHSA1/START domain